MMLATHRQIAPLPIVVGPSLQWNDALQKDARVAATSTTVRDETTDLARIERDLIVNALRQEHWNKATAARRLGMTHTQLYDRLRKYGLES